MATSLPCRDFNLLDKVANLGNLAEVAKVKDGYVFFGSVPNHDIPVDSAKHGVSVGKTQLRRPYSPLKSVGDYPFHLFYALLLSAHKCGSFQGTRMASLALSRMDIE